MAMAQTSTNSRDRQARRRPFSSWVKRLTHLKNSSADHMNGSSSKRTGASASKGKKQEPTPVKNNPYPLSGTVSGVRHRDATDANSDTQDFPRDSVSARSSSLDNQAPETSAKSTAPTVSTNGDTARSETGYSKAGTMVTGNAPTTGGGEGSTFSSPTPSVRSLTTTLTTVQSTAPSATLYGGNQNHHSHTNSASGAQLQVQFSAQYPHSSLPALPQHLATTQQPVTYHAATANGLLTDNASILTLASSSKRRRRNSLDTNASIRAIAPSSVFGGSRESLPLSVLSGPNAGGADASNTSVTNASGVVSASRPSMGGHASAERTSVYSTTGTSPLTPGAGERTSFIAGSKVSGGDNRDAGSIRSGLQSHSRNGSVAGSIGGSSPLTNNPLTSSTSSPNNATPAGRISRRSSGWGEISSETSDENEKHDNDHDDSPTQPNERNHENA
ncbi:hypothetical protein VTN31DRAFT_828 [Thermomyces dupontii]|uniref:uncharacterized protein n=1 Tax=Talaromyces thermophilus TaxID=28565 RepID=UPI003741F0B8